MRRLIPLLALTLFALSTAWAPYAAPTPEPVKKRAKVQTAIAWKVQPAEVEIYMDGKKLGRAGDLKQTRTRPGMHTVRLVKGGDETEMDVKVNKGHVLTFTFEFTE
ncbi:MAG: PEGA domain-containing protein [Deltaproteobacteria bacterium]